MHVRTTVDESTPLESEVIRSDLAVLLQSVVDALETAIHQLANIRHVFCGETRNKSSFCVNSLQLHISSELPCVRFADGFCCWNPTKPWCL